MLLSGNERWLPCQPLRLVEGPIVERSRGWQLQEVLCEPPAGPLLRMLVPVCEERVSFISAELLDDLVRRLELQPAQRMRCGRGEGRTLFVDSTNVLVRRGELLFKFGPVRGRPGLRREAAWLQRLAESGCDAVPRLWGVVDADDGMPFVLAIEWCEGSSLWDEVMQAKIPVAGALGGCARLLGRLHGAMGVGWSRTSDASGPGPDELDPPEPSDDWLEQLRREWGSLPPWTLAGEGHADFHFGQVLVGAKGTPLVAGLGPGPDWVALDFEGLPEDGPRRTGPPSDWPVMDLAGAWRSADYAATRGSLEWSGLDFRASVEQATLFLADYCAALEGAAKQSGTPVKPGPGPLRRASLERWFAIALLARNRWELDYEKRHRPEMVAVAEAGWGRTIRLASALLGPKR